MGCDIHAHIEYREDDEYGYEWFACPCLGQSYVLFALLANVRRAWVARHMSLDVSAVFEPRGIPHDASAGTTRGHDGCEYWDQSTGCWHFDAECHSGSWLGTDELAAVARAHSQILDVEPGVEVQATLRAMESLPHARLVFWFDN